MISTLLNLAGIGTQYRISINDEVATELRDILDPLSNASPLTEGCNELLLCLIQSELYSSALRKSALKSIWHLKRSAQSC